MLQTYEATLEPSGQVHFTDFSKPVVHSSQKILVTIVSPWVTSALTARPKLLATTAQVEAKKADWNIFSGRLKNTLALAGDPLAIQQQLRNEWR